MSFQNYSVFRPEHQVITALAFYRRVLDRIHQGGSIYYAPARLEAYAMVARLASELRTQNLSIIGHPTAEDAA